MARSVLAPLFVAVAACCLLAAAQAAQPRFQHIRSILTLGDSVADAGKLLLPALQAVAAHGLVVTPSRASVTTKRHQTRTGVEQQSEQALLTYFTMCLALDSCLQACRMASMPSTMPLGPTRSLDTMEASVHACHAAYFAAQQYCSDPLCANCSCPIPAPSLPQAASATAQVRRSIGGLAYVTYDMCTCGCQDCIACCTWVAQGQ